VGHFGPPFPAVGWALTLDRVLLAREMQGAAYTEPVPDVLFSSGGHSESLAWAGQARKHGLLVEVDPLGLPAEELWRSAQARGIARIARYRDPRTLLVRDRAGQRQVAVDDWEEVATWRGKR
jgi:histidyl-tRNA synthetase